MGTYTKFFALFTCISPHFFVSLQCTYERNISIFNFQYSMNNNFQSPKSLGRTELAQLYFPNIQPHSAWKKLRSLLADDPATTHLTQLQRRTFLPSEVNIIYQTLGHP